MLQRRTVLAGTLALGACAQGSLLPGATPSTTTPPTRPMTPPPPQQAIALDLPDRALPLRGWLGLPPGYGEVAAAAWPLVLFLHGSGERGDDLAAVKVHGPPKHAARGRAYPFILFSPQLEAGARWDPQVLHATLPVLRRRWRIDPDRICATGLSLGGHGVWNWAVAHPEDLAGIAPVCGNADDPTAVCRARSVPVRAYHGDADDVVPIAGQQACIDTLRACGGQAEFIVYPGGNHGAWEPAYEDPALVPWLLARRRTDPR